MADNLVEIHGTTDARFAPVREAFSRSFTEHGEVGASLSVVIRGQTVVDLWGGFSDRNRTQPWQRDTIVNLYSTTKGITALAGAILAGRGQLDYNANVTDYWPEFGQAGKQHMPVRYLFDHEAGLPYLEKELPHGGALDWDTMVHALEQQPPIWEPGTQMGYHAWTYGWLAGEVIRRIAGISVGQFVQRQISQPLGVDFTIGTPASDDARIAPMIQARIVASAATAPATPPEETMATRALGIVSPPYGARVNSREFRAAEIPAGNGHGNARALARIYGALAQGGEIDGIRIVEQPGLELATAEAVSGHDVVLNLEARRAMGFILSSPGGRYSWGPNPRAFGHSGAGGSLGFADPDAGIGFGYAMNQMSAGLGADPRWKPLIDAVYAAL